jgi:hypothetical protein
MHNLDTVVFRELLQRIVLSTRIKNDSFWLQTDDVIIPFRLTLWADVHRYRIYIFNFWSVEYILNLHTKHFAFLDAYGDNFLLIMGEHASRQVSVPRPIRCGANDNCFLHVIIFFTG